MTEKIIKGEFDKLKDRLSNLAATYEDKASELDYQMGDDFPFGSPCIRFNVPKGNVPSDKQKCQPKAQHEFIIKGMKITAASKKDAIKKYNHRKNQANTF